MKTVMLVAGGVAYGRLTAAKPSEEDSSDSMLSRLGSSSLAEAARDALSTTAAKGMKSLNKNLASRTEAMRNGTKAQDENEDDQDQDTDDVEGSEETQEEVDTDEEAAAKDGGS